MPNRKHTHFRYTILDACFRRKNNPFTFSELLEEVNERLAEVYPDSQISERTLRQDLRLFRDPENGFDADLQTKNIGGRTVYLYKDPDFSIAQRKLLPGEQYLIEAAQQLLDRFENHPKYDKLAEALVLFQEEESAATIPDYRHILFYDKNEAYEGLSLLKPLFLAIRKKQVLKITFQGFRDETAREFIFHPYVLKQYNQRWFVFGYNETRSQDHWSIPLDDRLQNFEVIPGFYREDSTDWNSFFNELVGVRRFSLTREDPVPETVVLRFAPHRLPYFKTKPIHPFWDEFLEAGREHDVFFETVINPELIQQILSYGKDVEVLEPEALRELVRGEVERLRDVYG